LPEKPDFQDKGNGAPGKRAGGGAATELKKTTLPPGNAPLEAGAFSWKLPSGKQGQEPRRCSENIIDTGFYRGKEEEERTGVEVAGQGRERLF